MRTSLVVVLFGLTACRHELAKPICVENPADPVCFEPGGDDAGSDAADADATPASCGDAGPVEEACGKCGRRQRTCVAPGVLGAWGACIDEKACTPGEVVDVAGPCPGALEKKTKTCGTSCEWEPEVCALPKGWTPIAAPPTGFVGRVQHSVVWTDAELIVFGGQRDRYDPSTHLRDGLRYSLKTNSWVPMAAPPGSFSAREGATAVWTGKKMFIWGGVGATAGSYLGDGALYDPSSNSWSVIAASPLAARSGHVTVWTGTRVFVWGGVGETDYLRDGATYDPATNTWTKIPDAPLWNRADAAAGWSGSEVLIFGGQSNAAYAPTDFLSDGGSFDPATNAWANLPEIPPGGRERFRAAFSVIPGGLFLYGGLRSITDPPYYVAQPDGLRLTPSGWKIVATPPESVLSDPARIGPGAWCADGRCYVWSGGVLKPGTTELSFASGGASFDLDSAKWSAMPSASEPTPRVLPGLVWTGTTAIVWGGEQETKAANDGAIFVP